MSVIVVTHDLFDECLGRITPTEREIDMARQHRDTVASRINLEGVRELINSGSYIKRTSIRPFTDIDLFVGFDTDVYETEAARVITRLHYHLGQSFPYSRVRLQTHSVGVIFADGFRVDVVPGFALKRRPGYYRVRDRDDGRWITTNITLHKEFFQRRLQRDARYRDMIRLVKYWKDQRRRKFGGFLMELLVAGAFRQGIPQGRDVALHAFFEWASEGGLRKPIRFDDFQSVSKGSVDPSAPMVVLDPANDESNVAQAVTEEALRELLEAADTARARSGTALRASSRMEASRAWRDILPAFPVP